MKYLYSSIILCSALMASTNLLQAQDQPVPAPVFGINGHTNFDMFSIAPNASNGEAIIQADGMVVIAGTSYPNFPWPQTTLVRFDPTCGQLDSTFGVNGIVVNPIEAVSTVNSLVVQSDGRLVAAGDVNAGFDTNGFPGIYRYNTDGSLDSTFNGNGYVKTTFRDGIGRINQLFLTADEKILAVVKGGSLFNMGCGVLKYNQNGDRDLSYGVDGFADMPYPYAPNQSGQGACLLDDESILIANQVGNDPFSPYFLSLAKITPDGLIDSTFNGNGYRQYPTIDFLLQQNYRVKMKELTDGRILMSYGINAPSQSIVKMLAFLPNGNIDSTFATNGMFTYGTTARPGDFVIDDENRILYFIASNWNDGPGAVLRLLPNGVLDESFGNNGIINFMHIPYPNVDYRKFNGGFLLPNGDILAYGDWAQGFVASRFTNNPDVDGIPQITQNGDVLSTIGLGSFQWYLDDEPIAGATENIYTPTSDGSYTVTMGFEFCTFTSEPFVIITTHTDAAIKPRLKIRNNPTHEYIYIDHADANMSWEVHSIEGRRLLSGKNDNNGSLNLSGIPAGVYIMRCTSDYGVESFKIMKL